MAFDSDPRWLGDLVPPEVDLPTVDRAAFKDALARLASGVAIVSCWDKGAPRGLLVSSITGLSVEPPRFLFCVRKEASSHDALLAAGACGIAILSADDEDEALRFASPSRAGERFSDPRWDLAPNAPPRLRAGLASTSCVIDQTIDAGGHTIVLVTARDLLSAPGAPLVAYDRGLRALAN